MMMLSRLTIALLVAIVLVWGSPAARAQSATAVNGALEGTISTQGGTVLLPGVLVLIRNGGGEQLAEQVSDGDGRIKIGDLPAGAYRINASLDGFESIERPVTIVPGSVVTISIDMPIASVSERVDVVASPDIATSGPLAAAETVSNVQAQWLAPGGSVQSALRLLATGIATPAGESINGGRPDQADFQIGAASLVDPRPFAVGSIAQTFEDYPNVGTLLPAMGYGRGQMEDLRETIARSDAELVLIGTPIDLRRLIELDKPALRVTYRLQELDEPGLAEILADRGIIERALV